MHGGFHGRVEVDQEECQKESWRLPGATGSAENKDRSIDPSHHPIESTRCDEQDQGHEGYEDHEPDQHLQSDSIDRIRGTSRALARCSLVHSSRPRFSAVDQGLRNGDFDK